MYLFDSESLKLRIGFNQRRVDRVDLSQTDFSMLCVRQSRPKSRQVVIETFYRTEIVMFMRKVQPHQVRDRARRGERLEVRRVTNVQLCPRVGRILNARRLLQNVNSLWKHAEHREQVDFLSVGLLFDAWEPRSMLLYPEFIVLYRDKASQTHPMVIPLFR